MTLEINGTTDYAATLNLLGDAAQAKVAKYAALHAPSPAEYPEGAGCLVKTRVNLMATVCFIGRLVLKALDLFKIIFNCCACLSFLHSRTHAARVALAKDPQVVEQSKTPKEKMEAATKFLMDLIARKGALITQDPPKVSLWDNFFNEVLSTFVTQTSDTGGWEIVGDASVKTADAFAKMKEEIKKAVAELVGSETFDRTALETELKAKAEAEKAVSGREESLLPETDSASAASSAGFFASILAFFSGPEKPTEDEQDDLCEILTSAVATTFVKPEFQKHVDAVKKLISEKGKGYFTKADWNQHTEDQQNTYKNSPEVCKAARDAAPGFSSENLAIQINNLFLEHAINVVVKEMQINIAEEINSDQEITFTQDEWNTAVEEATRTLMGCIPKNITKSEKNKTKIKSTLAARLAAEINPPMEKEEAKPDSDPVAI